MDIYNGKDPKNIMRGMMSRAQGAIFENMITQSCEWYKENGVAFIEKTPEPFHITRSLGGGKFIGNFAKQAQPDFKGALKYGQAIILEAKHTDSDRILKNRITPEQSASLDIYAEIGASCFVLVSFGIADIYMVGWSVWRNMHIIWGRKYVTKDDLTPDYAYKVAFDGQKIDFLGYLK